MIIKLNLARNCLKYLIKLYNITEIYIPYYSCKVLWHACQSENCKIKFYHINEKFLPVDKFPENSYILYINYFGLFGSNCQKLEKIYPNLIVDNTQAFYSKHYGHSSFNSLRKFFNVQNGAYLHTNLSLEKPFETDEFLYTPVTMQNNYEKFVQNEIILDKQEIKYIYPKVEKEISMLNFEQDKTNRIKNYLQYEKKYKKHNLINISLAKEVVPYCYPLCTNEENIISELKQSKTPYLSLWGAIPKDFYEHKFLNNTVALPLT